LAGEAPPDADICYLGGGYPELHARAISANTDFLDWLRCLHADGKRVVGECGGLMAMCSEIVTNDGRRHEMAGILSGAAVMSGRHGPSYVIGTSRKGRVVRGHEFHYSRVETSGGEFEYSLSRGLGIANGRDGLTSGRSVGSYMHQHVLGSESWAEDMIGEM